MGRAVRYTSCAINYYNDCPWLRLGFSRKVAQQELFRRVDPKELACSRDVIITHCAGSNRPSAVWVCYVEGRRWQEPLPWSSVGNMWRYSCVSCFIRIE